MVDDRNATQTVCNCGDGCVHYSIREVCKWGIVSTLDS